MTPKITPRRPATRSRWAALGAAVAVTIGGGGLIGADAAGPVSAPAPAVFVAVSPCRLMDTRTPDNVGPRTVAVGTNETYTIGVTGTHGHCTIPADAATVVMNITATGQTASSYLTVFAAGGSRPATSSLNWVAHGGDTANAVTATLSTSGELSFYNLRGDTDLVADVVGYYTSAPFDNIYTKAQVDALLAANPAGVGPVGATGPQGLPGSNGIDGAAGPQGDPGVKGDTGDSVLAGLTCTTDQVIAFDGTTWVCSDNTDTLAGLHCTANQSIGYDGNAWVCRNAPIVATLTKTDGFYAQFAPVSLYFQAYSPNVLGTGFCDGVTCQIHLVDVIDHTSCIPTFTGGPNAWRMTYVSTQNALYLQGFHLQSPGSSLYVTINCVT